MKVFAHTYWFALGKWSGERPPIVSTAWLTSTMPPFYKGAGVQFRVGSRSIRFGVCHPRMPVFVDPYAYVGDFEANLEALVGYEMDDQEISSWDSSRRSPGTGTPSTRPSSVASSPGSTDAASST